MPTKSPSQKACHNCRRRRLKCDRSVPTCLKCRSIGAECLGYGLLLRWQATATVKGSLNGQNVDPAPVAVNESEFAASRSQTQFTLSTDLVSYPGRHLIDPSLQDLPRPMRYYADYFLRQVCADLILYDDPAHSPYHGLLGQSAQHQVLLHMITASAARHLHNASREQRAWNSNIPPRTADATTLGSTSTDLAVRPYYDSIAAECRAINSFVGLLNSMNPNDTDAILAALLLFIEFELMDLSRDTWRKHMNGARSVVSQIIRRQPINRDMSALRISLLGGWLIFDIMASMLVPLEHSSAIDINDEDALWLMQESEANHYMSCPALLLHVIRHAAELSRILRCPLQALEVENHRSVLLDTVANFDPEAWASNLQLVSPRNDLAERAHVASAHKAATTIYVHRVLQTSPSADTLEDLVARIIYHTGCIPLNNPIVKATPWAIFIAGAETQDPLHRAWIAGRLNDLWAVIPWGYVRNAMKILEARWQLREDGQPDANYQNWSKGLSNAGYEWFIC